MRKIKVFFTVLAMLLSTVAFAQNVKVTGVVKDSSTGEPVPFAAIQVKGTTVGSSTDVYGTFTMNVPANATLIFSSIGYINSEVAVAGKTNLTVTLKPDTEALEETIVIGYGSGKKIESVVGTAATVSKAVLQNRPVASVGDVLQGQVAGLQVYTSSGEPSAGVSMRLRGVNSINASNTPLYVLDGAPVSSSIFTTINPNDIENITVLKDASSTSIYGSRAANGVVFITTKKGTQERAQVRLNTSYGVSNLAQYPVEMCNTEEYFNLREIIDPSLKTNSEFQRLKNERLERPDLFNFDWRNWILRKNAPTKNADLSISGRSRTSDYYISANAFDQQGIEPYSFMSRYGVRSNINTQVADWLKVGVNMALTLTSSKSSGYSGTGNSWYNPMSISYWSLPYTTPYDVLRDENGKITGLSDKEADYFEDGGMYSYFFLMKFQPSKSEQLRLNANTYQQLTPIKGLTLKASQALEGYDSRSSSKVLPLEGSPFSSTSASESFSRYFQVTMTNTAEYKFNITDNHEFTFLAGQEWIYSRSNGFGASSTGQTDIRLDEVNKGTTPGTPSYSWSEDSYNSFFLRGNYDLFGRYSLEASFRRDGSSLFGVHKRWANFWAVGAMWNVKKEDFLKNVSEINSLRFRVNYGTTGNSGISNYLAFGTVGTSSKYQGSETLGLSGVANPDLTWETVASTNVGISGRFFNKFDVSVDVYSKKTSNMLMDIPFSYATGFSSGTGNVGAMTNKGIEFEFAYDILQTRDWYLNAAFNFGYNKNTITELFGGRDEFIVPNTGIKYQVGKTYGDLYYVKYLGVDPATGAPVYQNEDGTLTSEFNEDNAVFTGYNRYAPWSGGLQLNASWKGISLNATFSGVFGKYMLNNDRYFLENPNFISESNVSKHLFTIWTKPGDITDIPGAQYPVKFSSRFVENASFARLKNLQLSYTVPQSLIQKTGFISGLRVYAVGRNLLTWTPYTGYDPEVDTNVSMGRYPNSKQYSFGLELTF